MTSPLINRTPPLMQKTANRPGSHNAQSSHDAGAAMQTPAHGTTTPGTGGAVDKSA